MKTKGVTNIKCFLLLYPGMTLIVDTVTPPLRRVFVYGTLKFQDTMDHVFQTEIMAIQVSAKAASIIIPHWVQM